MVAFGFLAMSLVTVSLPGNCAMRCPCVVPAGIDFHSAPVMVPRARRDAQAVFLGHVVAVDTLVRDTLPWAADSTQSSHPVIRARVVRYTFAIQQTWKGSRSRQVQIVDYDSDTSCGRKYAAGVSYLVYAARDRRGVDPAGLSTYSCSRALPADAAAEDVRILGPGRAPRD